MANARRLMRVLRHRQFRLFWLAQSFSVVGDRIITVALALFITDLTGSATDLGIVLAAHALPLVGFLLIGGVWADRLPRKQLIVATDLIRFVLHATLAALIFAGSAEVWHVVVIEVLFGTAEAFFRPAATALIPQTVPEEEIQEANALVGMSNNLAEFLGPALATALVLGVGAGMAFAIDAATFVASALLMIRIKPRRRSLAEAEEEALAAEGRGMLSELRAGFAEVRSRVWIWATLASFSVTLCFGVGPFFVLGPLVAEEQYGSVGIFGVMEACLGAGLIVGSLLAIRWRPLYPMRLAVIFACLWPPGVILFAAGVPLGIVLPVVIVGGVGLALFETWWLTALAERIPPDKLSRVTSYDWMASLGLLPLGFVLAGPLADAYGAIEVLLIGTAVATVAAIAGTLPRQTRMLRRLDRHIPQPVDDRPAIL
jgi:MFS family permease